MSDSQHAVDKDGRDRGAARVVLAELFTHLHQLRVCILVHANHGLSEEHKRLLVKLRKVRRLCAQELGNLLPRRTRDKLRNDEVLDVFTCKVPYITRTFQKANLSAQSNDAEPIDSPPAMWRSVVTRV